MFSLGGPTLKKKNTRPLFYSISRKPALTIAKIEGIAYICIHSPVFYSIELAVMISLHNNVYFIITDFE